ncbi:MAG: MFS transporter [Lachnospiraceae bacterium]
MKSSGYKKTLVSCFIGYIVQAVVNNFVPLLFLMFQDSYNIPLSKITLLITINFIIQLIVDLLSAGFIDKIGYRASMLIAHICSAAGFLCLTILPDIMPDSFTGLLISVIIYAIGGGLLEVIVSPIVESCPTENKEKAMSLLHSFYCWGHVGVVLVSTIFFNTLGISQWKILSLIWSMIPILNIFLFIKAPMSAPIESGQKGLSIKELFSDKLFLIFLLMMICAGAGEQSVSQWASAYAEMGLNIDKTIGDLAGPMMFALMMGLSRFFYGKYGHKINLDSFMLFSTLLCILSYICISFIPIPALGLLFCGICGMSVGIMWPGTFSKAAAAIKSGGTAMFALMALAGDLGCSAGPTIVGTISHIFNDNLRLGILAAVIFPLAMLFSILIIRKTGAGLSKYSA